MKTDIPENYRNTIAIEPPLSIAIQSTPDNSNLQGKSKKGLSYREFEENSREYSKKQFLLHSEHFNHI